MSTLFPSNIDVPQTNVDDADFVLAADMNNVQDSANAAQVAIGANPLTITDGMGANPLAAPNVLGGYNGTILNYPTPGANGSQVGFASVVATMIKRMLGSGSANWRTSPVIDLTQIRGLSAITVGNDTGAFPNSVAIYSVITGGPLAGRPAAATGNTGWLYRITAGGDASNPNGALQRSNGVTWSNVGFYPTGTPVGGELIYYDSAAQSWRMLAATGAGTSLMRTGTALFWGTANGLMLNAPSVYDPDAGTWTAYSSIQTAIAAALNGDTVAIPPGIYAEYLTLKYGVDVREMIPGTVVLGNPNPNLTTPLITAVSGSTLSVAIISCTTDGVEAHAIETSGPLDQPCIIRAERIDSVAVNAGGIGACIYADSTLDMEVYVDTLQPFGTASGVADGIVLGAGAGNVRVFSKQGISDAAAARYGVNVGGGSLTLKGGTYSGATNSLRRTAGTLQVHNVQYDTAKASGAIKFLDGDRMRPAQSRLFNQSFS